jgi:murein DD-endopeptidase MepM/ murein hydrolase activator NlpD
MANEEQNLDPAQSDFKPEQFNPQQPGGPAINAPQASPVSADVINNAKEPDNQDRGRVSAVIDQIKKQATQYAKKIVSKYLTKAIIIPALPYILAALLIIAAIILAIVLINRYYKGHAGRSQAQAASIYSADDMAYIQQILSQNPGGMISPLLRKSKSDIVSPWAKKRKGYTHRGIDISAPNQTPLYAATDGKIVYLKDDLSNSVKGYGSNANGGFGNTIIVQVTGGQWDGFFWEIHHLYPSSATKAKMFLGGSVFKGQPIGEVGNNGASSGPHMHFQVDLPNVVQGKRTQSKCEDAVLNLKRPCGAGTTGNYDNPGADTINPIIPLGW